MKTRVWRDDEAPRTRPGTRRRAVLGVTALAAALAGSITALANASPRPVTRDAVIVTKLVAAPGSYRVTIDVRGRSAALNHVLVRIGGVDRQTVTDRRHRHKRITLRLHIAGPTLTVRAVGGRARPMLAVKMRPITLRSTAAPVTTPAPVVATPAPAAPAPAPVVTPPAPSGGPPGAGSPYTNLVWSDDFTQDYVHEGNQGNEPIPSTWGLDSYGGCGDSPPQESSYPASRNDAYVSPQGLVIPVVATGPTSYTTAQLDTRGIAGESWQYGTFEASIELPTGQGLCPAFWMYGDSGTAEIDILEAPSFVGSSYGPLASFSVFTLHANNTQQFEFNVAPAGWNPGAPNVYGLIWTPTSITWTLNYVPYATATPASLENPALWSSFTSGKLHLLIDEAVGGWPGDPPAGTTYTKPMTVQWVKVYQ